MVNKNITMRTLNDDGAYSKLYPQTSATQSEVSAETQQLFGQSDVNTCLDKISNVIGILGKVIVKIVDVDGNPVEGATITGIGGGVTTNSNGLAGGILTSSTITVTSPYADMINTTADVKDHIGEITPVVITVPSVADGGIVRYSMSRSVRFSNRVDTIDICCVGAGGGGGASGTYSISTSTGYNLHACTGAGGGGGDVKNSLGVSVTANTNYPLVIGAGGAAGLYNSTFTNGRTSGDGGTTSFMGLSATGGYGGNGWDVGWYYSDDGFMQYSVIPQAATQGGLGGGASQTIVRAYTISGASRFSSGWLAATKDSTTPLNPQVGILYRVKYDVSSGTTNISNLNGFYIWTGSQYALADMTTLATVGGNGGDGYAYVDRNQTHTYEPSNGVASSSTAVEFDSTTKQAGGGAGGSRTTTALTPGAPNGGAGGTTTASYGSTGGYGGGGGGAGYVSVNTDYNDQGGNSGGTGGSGMVAIRIHLK